MCNRYQSYVNRGKMFGRDLDDIARGINLPTNEVNPGGQGVVMLSDWTVRKMDWGFTTPKFSKRDPKKAIKPSIWNNTRSENLHIPLWRNSFVERRCLIPVVRFAEAEGPKGQMTRTWFAVPAGDYAEEDHFSVAGIWREEAQSMVYSMVMTSCAPPMTRIHDRMPVILAPDDRAQWLSGEPDEAQRLCLPWTGPLTEDRTNERWYAPKSD